MSMSNFIQKKLISIIKQKNPKLGTIAENAIRNNSSPVAAIKNCIKNNEISIADYQNMKNAYLSGSMNIPFVKLSREDFEKMDDELGITNFDQNSKNQNQFRF